MKIVSVQVGMPRTVSWKGKEVSTGIFKDTVTGKVKVGKLNLAGDGQADLKVHGGIYKSVYSYASENYVYWHKTLGGERLPNGMFGENLTTDGLMESDISVGDRLRFGTALLEAVEPRFPCFKLQIRFNDDSILKKFMDSGLLGIYYKVLEQGEVFAGAPIQIEHRDSRGLRIFDIGNAKRNIGNITPILKKMAEHPSLDPQWREWAAERLTRV